MCAHRACYFTTDFIAVWLCNLLLLYTAAWSNTPKTQSVACGHIVPATLLLLFTTAFYCYLTVWVWSYCCFTNCCFSWFTYRCFTYCCTAALLTAGLLTAALLALLNAALPTAVFLTLLYGANCFTCRCTRPRVVFKWICGCASLWATTTQKLGRWLIYCCFLLLLLLRCWFLLLQHAAVPLCQRLLPRNLAGGFHFTYQHHIIRTIQVLLYLSTSSSYA
jgi:hypothetical protein